MTEALGDGKLPEQLDLQIELPLRFHGRERELAERRFVAALEKATREATDHRQLEERGYAQGHVFCHWCGEPECEHSRPGEARQVFVGYEPTGQPRWRDFASWVVERKDPRLDRLYEDDPQPLALHSTGSELVTDLLSGFGKRRTPYRIIGQIACGLFPVPAPRSKTTQPAGPKRAGTRPLPDRIAVSIQLIENRGVHGEPSFGLNLVGNPPGDDPLGSALVTLVEERISPLFSRFVGALRADTRELEQKIIEGRRAGRRLSVSQCRALAEEMLERAPARLEKILRRKDRQTQHAEDRTKNPNRPTASAFSDAINAKNEDLLRDRRENTRIVKGPHNRVHVFREDGTHITSIVYPGETIRDRTRSGRWAALTDEERQTLREAIEKKIDRRTDEDAD